MKSKIPLCLMPVQRKNTVLNGVYLRWCHQYNQFFTAISAPLCSITWQHLAPSSPSLSSSQRSSVCSMTAWPRAASLTASSSSRACAPYCRSPSVSGQRTCCWFIALFALLWGNIVKTVNSTVKSYIYKIYIEHIVTEYDYIDNFHTWFGCSCHPV